MVKIQRSNKRTGTATYRFYGGIGSKRVGNYIRGVARCNPKGRRYHDASNVYFGNLAPYTGYLAYNRKSHIAKKYVFPIYIKGMTDLEFYKTWCLIRLDYECLRTLEIEKDHSNYDEIRSCTIKDINDMKKNF